MDIATLELFSDRPLELEGGRQIGPVTVRLETWGPPDPAHVVLICHALTGDAHAARHHEDDVPGWWDFLIGPGKPIDTDRHWVICLNVLGGAAGTTGPSSPAPDGTPWADRFPLVTVGDIVEVQKAALDALGVTRMELAIGGSLGGMQALEWAWRFPDRVDAVGAVGAADCLAPMGVGLNAAQREAVRLGWEAGRVDEGLSVARMIAMLSYRSAAHFEGRFGRALQPGADRHAAPTETRFQVESYLRYQGTKLARRFDPWSYIVLSRAMDLYELFTPGRTVSGSRADIHLAGLSDDWLFPADQVRDLAERLRRGGGRSTYTHIVSDVGHDGFLVDLPALSRWVRGLFTTTRVVPASGRPRATTAGPAAGISGAPPPTSLSTRP